MKRFTYETGVRTKKECANPENLDLRILLHDVGIIHQNENKIQEKILIFTDTKNGGLSMNDSPPFL